MDMSPPLARYFQQSCQFIRIVVFESPSGVVPGGNDC